MAPLTFRHIRAILHDLGMAMPKDEGDWLFPLQKGEPTSTFWKIWRQRKAELKEWGFTTIKKDDKWLVFYDFKLPPTRNI